MFIKNILINILLVIFPIFLALVFFETFLIWDNYYKEYEDTYNKEINNIEYSFFVDKKLLENNLNPKLYILGDSFVSGDACAYKNENLPGHMQNILTKKGYNFDVINLGIEGLSVTHYFDFINHFDIKKDDVVLLVLYDNDIFVSRQMCGLAKIHNDQEGSFYPSMCNDILSGIKADAANTGLLRNFNNQIRNIKTIKLLKEVSFNLPYLSKIFFRSEFRDLWSDFESEENIYISEMIKLTKDRTESLGAKFLLSYYPNTNKIDKNDPMHKIWMNYFNYLKTNYNLYVLDPYPYIIDNAPKPSMTWSLSDKHPSCDAHYITANYFISNAMILDE